MTRLDRDGDDGNDGNEGIGIFLFPINILFGQTKLPLFFQMMLLFKVVVAKCRASFDIDIFYPFGVSA